MPGFVLLKDALRELGVTYATLRKRLRARGIPTYEFPSDTRQLMIRESDFAELRRPRMVGQRFGEGVSHARA